MLSPLEAALAKFRVDVTRDAPDRALRWRDDPVLFAQEVLGFEPWQLQAAVLMAVAEHHRVAVRSGHKVGKSLLLATLALWWCLTRKHGRVLMTAPTSRQVRRILWKEVRRLAIACKEPLPPVAKDPGTGIQWDDGRDIVGFSTDDTENMGGFSGPEILFLVDEASGVSEEIFEAIEGNLAGGSAHDSSAVAKLVLAGNPTQTSGTFYDAFHKARSEWRCHHISSEQTPNAKSGRVLVPGLATSHYVEQKRKAWGVESPLYQVRVAGNFPRQGSDAVIPLSLVELAVERWHDTKAEGRLELGVDVARFGDDDSVIAARRGQKILSITTRNGLDEIQLSGLVLEVVKRLYSKGEQYPLVKVDAVGVGGGVATLLRQHDHLEVIEVMGSEKSTSPDEYPNLRSQLWFGVAAWLDDGGAIPDDDELQAELVAPSYSFDAQGRRVVEPKDKFKRRLKRSPDRADAVAMAIYSPPQALGFFAPKVVKQGAGYRYSGLGRGF